MYALREVFQAGHVEPTRDNVLGVLSLVFWSLALIVSLKYVVLVLRAANHGEGGTMALMALASRCTRAAPRLHRALIVMGIGGAALFFGDGIITPSISVLSAIEGLEVATPTFKPYVVPITLGVLRALSPLHAVRFLAGHGATALPVLGAVFLAVTGAEALYADMGHFGRRPIRVAWFGSCGRRCRSTISGRAR